VFKPIESDLELIDLDDHFLLFEYLAKLPPDKKKSAMEEDTPLGTRLRTVWANYLKFKERERRSRPPRRERRRPSEC